MSHDWSELLLFAKSFFYSEEKSLDQSFASYLAAINRQVGAIFSYSLITEKEQLYARLNSRTLIVLENQIMSCRRTCSQTELPLL